MPYYQAEDESLEDKVQEVENKLEDFYSQVEDAMECLNEADPEEAMRILAKALKEYR
jgi:hypothetical protein